MPLIQDMDNSEKRRAVRRVNYKISALRNAKARLRSRRDTVANLSSNQLLRISLELTRLQWKVNELRDLKAAWKLNQKRLPAPSEAALKKMKKRVSDIAALNVINNNASQIVQAATEIAGALRFPSAAG